MLAFAVVWCFAPSACEGGDGHTHHSAAEGVRAGVTSLDACTDGDRLHVLTVTRDADLNLRFEHQRSFDAGETWSAPIAVGEDQPLPEIAKRGQDAQIAASGDRLVALWTTRNGDNRFGRGPLTSAISSDGGRNWSPGGNPANDGSSGDHSFIDLAADDHGIFHAVWLDARHGSKGLIYSRSIDGGVTWEKNQTLSPETCECCWNTIITRAGGEIIVLYRARAPRDMAVVRSGDGGNTWSDPETVGNFDWDINACPHVGGGLATAGDTLIATVWTGHASSFGAYVLRKTDEAKWSEPRRLGTPDAKHTDVASDGNAVAVTWDAYTETGNAIFIARSDDAGATWPLSRRITPNGTSASHPRVLKTARGFRVFWTQQRGAAPMTWTSQLLDAADAPAQQKTP